MALLEGIRQPRQIDVTALRDDDDTDRKQQSLAIAVTAAAPPTSSSALSSSSASLSAGCGAPGDEFAAAAAATVAEAGTAGGLLTGCVRGSNCSPLSSGCWEKIQGSSGFISSDRANRDRQAGKSRNSRRLIPPLASTNERPTVTANTLSSRLRYWPRPDAASAACTPASSCAAESVSTDGDALSIPHTSVLRSPFVLLALALSLQGAPPTYRRQ